MPCLRSKFNFEVYNHMKMFKKTLIAAAAVSTLSFAVAPVAVAEVAASATISSAYLWRGYDLGQGDAALSADIVWSEGGFSGGLWVSSGDAAMGTEYDIFAGYSGSVGELSYGITYISYIYPSADTLNGAGDLEEGVYSLGYGPVSLTMYDSLAGDYSYTTLGYDAGKFSLMYGVHDNGANDQENFDVTYSYNDSLSFTYSIPFGSTVEEAEPTLVASYSLPF
jgi:uncharacterized protein (TIGR02001 family)